MGTNDYKEPTEIIDIHCHTFNLKYLPLAGVLTAYTRNIIPVKVAKFLEDVLIKLTNSSNLKIIENKSYLDDSSETFTEDLLAMTEDELIEDLANKASYIVDLLDEELMNEAFNFIEPKEMKDSLLIQYSYKKEDDGEYRKFIEFNFLKLFKGILRGFDYLKWFRFMMRQEKTIYKYLLKHNKGIDKYVFHMLDTYKSFKMANGDYSEPKFSIQTQVSKMKGLIDYSSDNLIGFIGFSPNRKNSLNIVKDAIKSGYFKGVKFYPPMGYKPIGNKDKSIDKNNLELFRWCIANDIPIFTHCTPTGFEANPKKNSGQNANPKFWEDLLKINEFNDLRLCLGHAGGEEGWKSSFSSNNPFPDYYDKKEKQKVTPYSKLVYELCIKYKNVYCEVGFLSHIYDNVEEKNFIERLKYLLEYQNPIGTYNFSKKICYGSDYHILYNDGLQKTYLDKFIDIFSSTKFDNHRENFFHINSKNFLKITSNRQIGDDIK